MFLLCDQAAGEWLILYWTLIVIYLIYYCRVVSINYYWFNGLLRSIRLLNVITDTPSRDDCDQKITGAFYF